MTYYRGTNPYPHPTDPALVLCYIRNRLGWRVAVSPADGEKLRPYDLFQNRAGIVVCKTITGKQFPLTQLVANSSLFRHVVEYTLPPLSSTAH